MKDDRVYLIYIRETLARVKGYTKGGKATFLESEMVQDAAIRNLQVLAESTQRLSDKFKQQHPQINWPGMAGFRNILVHGYLSIDLSRVWEVIERDLPALEGHLGEAFGALPAPPDPERKKKTKEATRKPGKSKKKSKKPTRKSRQRKK